MRKGLNKKGFSLVELMIVVVIMGILIAVAIPLYGAITDSAEAKSCGSNQRIIRAAFANWVLMDDKLNTADTLFLTSAKSFNASMRCNVLPLKLIDSFVSLYFFSSITLIF